MKFIKTYESFNEMNEGKFLRGTLKTAATVGLVFKSLLNFFTLNWKEIKRDISTELPMVYKVINILDTFKSSKSFWAKDILIQYEQDFGTDMIQDLNEMSDYINSRLEEKPDNEKLLKTKEHISNLVKMVDDMMYDDEEFRQQLHELKNKITGLSQGYIDYPEEWFDKPISQMSEDELRKEMDKALDDKDFHKSRYINKYLNRDNE